MAELGFLVLCVLIGNAWLTRRRLKDLEELVQAQDEGRRRLKELETLVRAQGESAMDLLRRVSALERGQVQAAAAPTATAPVAAQPAPVPAGAHSPLPAPPPPPIDANFGAEGAGGGSLPPGRAGVGSGGRLGGGRSEEVAATPLLASPLSQPPPPRGEEPPPRDASTGTLASSPPLPPRPAPPPRVAPPPKPPRPPFDWESLVGVKLFSWIAGILLALAAIQFLRYTIDHGWMKPPIRMAMGLVLGAGLLLFCELRVARRYAITANALGAAGIVTLFSTFFAAHTLWHLLGPAPTFGGMVLVTAVAVVLSIRHDALFIALLGLVGGFATPVLLSTGQDHPFGLFGYLLLLNAGLAWVALRKSWPVLSILCLAFTTLYQWGWVFKFLNAEKLPLALGIFLIFPLLAFLAPALVQAKGKEAAGSEEGRNAFARTARVGALLPLGFALFLAAVPAYGARFGLLFGFLFVLQVGLAAVAAVRGPRALHPAAAGATLLAYVLWFGTSYPRGEAWPAVLGFVALFVLFDLAAPWLARRLGQPLDEEGRLGSLAGPLLLFTFPVLFLQEPAAAAPGLPFAVLFALLAATAAFALLEEDGLLHSIAAFFAIAAEAVWSAQSLTPERLLAGIAIYAIFGLFYLGVPLLARRLDRRLPPAGSGAFLLLLSLGLLFFLAAGPLAQAALWGLALLLVILNAGLFLEAGTLRRPLLALAGTLLSWLLIAVWWVTVPLAASLVPALFLVAGFAVLGLAGNLWMQRRTGGTGGAEGGTAGDPLAGGPYLALVGHAFLLVVAAQPRLSIPPWPFLGVLVVLDLAAGVAALWLRKASLWIAALAASDLVLLAWVATARDAPWPAVAVGSALGFSALGLLWIALGKRVTRRAGRPGTPGMPEKPGELPETLAQGAVPSLLLGHAVATVASMVSGAPPLAFTAGAHLAFLVALLALSVRIGWAWLAPFSVVFTTVAVAVWRLGQGDGAPWWHELAFAAVLYLPYLAFPLVLGERARRLRPPYLAAVLASVPFFLFAQEALVHGGFKGVIGALPVAQALALTVLLARLVRFERTGPAADRERERDPGRLALLAGAVLAFVTAAIPLQLDREWITLGWALLAAALAALYLRIPHRGLLYWTAGLLVAVFVRLAFNPAVLAYHPRGSLVIWNWYLYTYLVPALAFFLAAWLLAKGDDRLADPPFPRLSSFAVSGAVVLTFLLVNIEIADFFSPGTSLTFRFLTGEATLAEDLAYTLGWALFAIALFVAGIVGPNRPARITAIVLLLVAVLKGSLHDILQLGGLYKIGSLAGLAVCLTLMAVLTQKYVLPKRGAE